MEWEGILIGLLIVLAGVISIEIGISAAILEIIAGLIGYNFLGLSDLPWLEFLSNFGILGIMFFAGFEIDEEVLKRYFKKSVLIGFTSYFFPFTSLFLLSFFVFNFPLKTSLLVGISTSTTSLALVYPVLKEKKLLKLKTGHILLGSAMVVDLLSIISLAILFGTVDVFLVVYIAIALFLLYMAPKIGKWIFSRYKGNVIELEMKFILLILLSLALISEKLYASEAVFVFMAGLVFSALLREHAALEKKLRGIIFGFMAPLFFFRAGSMINVRLVDLEILWFMMLLCSMAFLSKYIGTYMVTRRVLRVQFSSLSGLLFNYRLTFGIIAAVFGLKFGLISDGLYFALLLTILLTSIFSSVLLRIFLKVIPSELEKV